MSTSALVGGAVGIVIGFIAGLFANAPLGYEDETGFYYGRPPREPMRPLLDHLDDAALYLTGPGSDTRPEIHLHPGA